MGRQLPKDAFCDIPPLHLSKGRNERLVIQPWVRNGYAYISLGIADLQEDGVTYEFTRRKGFALSLRESKEFLLRLATQVLQAEMRMHEILALEEEEPTPEEEVSL